MPRFSLPWINPTVMKWVESVASLGLMAGLQLVAFVVLARAMGASDYAVIVSIASVVTITVEIVALGSGDALIRSVARDRSSYSEAIGTALTMFLVTLPPVAMLSVAIVWAMSKQPEHFYPIVMLTISELVSARSLALGEQIAVAHEDFRAAALTRVVPNVVRALIVFVACFALGVKSVDQWWPIQFLFGSILSPIMLGVAVIRYGRPHFPTKKGFHSRNIYFALTQLSRALQQNIDKIVAGFFFSSAILGNYGVASRLTQYALLPVQSALRILNPRFYRAGQQGVAATRRLVYKSVGVMLGLAFSITVILNLVAVYLSVYLGESFGHLESSLRILSILPIVTTLQYLFADALTGADHPQLRVAAIVVGVVLIALLCFAGAQFGLTGMIFGLIVANVITFGIMCGMVEYLYRRENRERVSSVAAG